MSNKIYDGIMGLVVGDALGVPYEFMVREYINCNCRDMTGFGTYNQPPGTWSDDSSMTLATLVSLARNEGKINLEDIMNRFRGWLYDKLYTPHGVTFDVGHTTRCSIARYDIVKKNLDTCGGKALSDNGNGSLMRILPLAFVDTTDEDICAVSSLTHAHHIATTACKIYVAIANALLHDVHKEDAVLDALGRYRHLMTTEFLRLFDIQNYSREVIQSDGYVIHTLEAALWCFLTTDNYSDCVLTAVNLGNDTDTTAAVAGGLAGLYYGVGDENEGIPEYWIEKIAKKEWIKDVCYNLDDILEQKSEGETKK